MKLKPSVCLIFVGAALTIFGTALFLQTKPVAQVPKNDESVIPAKPLPDISKTLPAQQAVRDKLIAMLDPHDPNSIFKVVDVIGADKALALNCHDVGHDIGHKAYELYGFLDAMTFNNPEHLKHTLVEYICAGGYMHGIVEELALHEPKFKAAPDILCAQVPDAHRESCYHGIGHALMFSDDRHAEAALTDCRNIQHSKDMYRCFEGVWMELFWGNAQAPASSFGWDIQKPLAPCIAAKDDEKPTCFLYAPFGYLRTHVKDYPGAVQTCARSGLSNSDAQFCLKGLGITMMSKFKGQHLESSEMYVDGLPTEQKRAFYEGVLGYATLSGISNDELTATCALFKTDSAICESVLRAR